MSESSITLPTEVVMSDTKDPKCLLLYSLPKIGKTTFLSQLPGCLILDFENGSDYIDALKIKVNNFEELTEVGKQILAKKKPYKYVAIDTVTELETWCEKDATLMYMQSSIGKNFNTNEKGERLPESQWQSVLSLPKGAGYFWLRESFKKWAGKCMKLADRVIFIGHLKDKFIDKKGKEVAAKDLDLTGKLKNIVTQTYADSIGYMYRNSEGELRVSFETSDEVACGSRCQHLKGVDIPADWDKIFLDK